MVEHAIGVISTVSGPDGRIWFHSELLTDEQLSIKISEA